MKRFRAGFAGGRVVLLLVTLFAFAPRSGPAAFAATAPAVHIPPPPPTRTEVVRDTLHGVVIEDPYRWLEDQDAPATRAWIEAQNSHTDSVLSQVTGRDRIQARLEQLLRIDSQGVPFERGGRYFYSRRLATQDLSVLYMRQGLAGKEEVLVDPHPLSPDHGMSVSFADISYDGTLLAYGTRQGGQDEVTITFLDLDSRKELADRLPRARYQGISITLDKKGLYYGKHTPEGSRVYYHAFGTDAAKDPELFGKGYGPDKIIYAGLTDDGRYLLLQVYYGSAEERSDLFFKNVAADGPITAIAKDIPAYFEGAVAGDVMYMRTNLDAPNGRILRVDLAHPERERWKEIVPTGPHALESYSLVGGKLFVNYLENVVSKVKIFDPDGKLAGTIAFPTLGTVSGMSGRWQRSEAFFTFMSFHVPPTIYRYDAASGKQEVWWRSAAPVQSEQFEVKQVWYTSKDGTRVPMFLVHKKGLKLDGSNPTLLTGYGGFTVNETPGFSSRAVCWVENGGVFALPNLRGGAEFGETWHKAGMLGKKQNVFDDFLAAARWLIDNGYTNPQKLAITGGSNGGLLVGAAMTQHPELFRAIVCSVPLLDMLRYHRFLVARFWVPEYGSSEDPEQFKWLQAYSPYHHVKKGEKYPAVLFISGDSDTRVAPLHARKMTALVQASTGSDRPVLLRYDTKSGHAAGKPVKKVIQDTADELQFLMWQLDASPGPLGMMAK